MRRTGEGSRSGADRRERGLVLSAVGLIALVILLARLFQLQVLTADHSQAMAERNWLRPEYLTGPRGRILDRDGRVLADVRPSYTIVIDPNTEPLVRDPEALDAALTTLASLVGGSVERYRTEVARQRYRTYKPIRLERNVDSTRVARVEEHRSLLPGIAVDVEAVRDYPADTLACHILGYVNEVSDRDLETLEERGYRAGSIMGRTGVERRYEEQLRGEEGIHYVEVNALGRRSEAFLRDEPVPPRSGRDIVLTLDSVLQEAAEAALEGAGFDVKGEEAGEVRGAVVLMDVWSGEILAIASRPGFDSNVFSGVISPELWRDLNRPERPQINRAVHAAYPPGSVFKMLTAYAGMMEGHIDPATTRVYCNGRYPYGNSIKKCWKRGGHGSMNLLTSISESCDVFFYQAGVSLGVDGIARYADLFGIDDRTGIDLPRERKGNVPDKAWYDERFGVRGWSRGVALNLVIGQGEILLTPIALAQHTAVLATGGRRPRPHLLKELGGGREDEPRDGAISMAQSDRVPLDAARMALIQQGMEMAASVGTAKGSRVPAVAVAGKTGTAENPGFDHALYIGYAPAENPEVAVVVVLENRGHGGAVAAPVAQKILYAYFTQPDRVPRGESE